MKPNFVSTLVTVRKKYIMEFILLFLCVILSLTAPRFLTAGNLLNVLRNISMRGIIAFGMTVVIISGEIDLSVGSMVAFGGCFTAFVTGLFKDMHVNLALGIVLGTVLSMGIGFAVGGFTAIVRNKFAVPTFITTLAFMAVLSGVAMLITNGFPLTPFPQWFNFIGSGYIFGVIPFPAVIFVIVFVILFITMKHTPFGRAVYAVGGNAEAARLSGIKMHRIKFISLGITAMLAALAGVMVSAQIMSGTPTTGRGWELEVISAVIIGGTSFTGGEGKIWGTFIGIVFLGIIFNGLTLLGVSEYWQYVIRGSLILAAVLLNTIQKRK